MGDQGLLVVLCGPSGAGKTTLVHHAQRVFPDLRFSVSFTTRPMRTGEEHGRDYFFTTAEDFEARLGRGEFLEHAVVHGNRYGTHRPQIDELIASGAVVLLDIDVQGAVQVRSQDVDPLFIFVLPPSFSELERRLRARGTDEDAVIQRRLAVARSEMGYAPWFPYILINSELAVACSDLEAVIRAERVRRSRASRLARVRAS